MSGWAPSGSYDTGYQPPRQRWDHPERESVWTADPDGPDGPLRTPNAAKPPTVPGNGQAEELGRMALRAVVEHWPGDLRGVSLCVEQWPGHRMGATVKLSAHTPRPLGLLIGFSARELREGSPAVAQRIRVEHREWARVT